LGQKPEQALEDLLDLMQLPSHRVDSPETMMQQPGRHQPMDG
jgi:hypothetical protein